MKLSINGRTYYGVTAKAGFEVNAGDSVFVDERGHFLVHFTPEQTEALTRLGEAPPPEPDKEAKPGLGGSKQGEAKRAILREMASVDGEFTSRELSTSLNIDKLLVSQCLYLLNKQGLTRSRKPEGAKLLMWSITPKGRRAIS